MMDGDEGVLDRFADEDPDTELADNGYTAPSVEAVFGNLPARNKKLLVKGLDAADRTLRDRFARAMARLSKHEHCARLLAEQAQQCRQQLQMYITQINGMNKDEFDKPGAESLIDTWHLDLVSHLDSIEEYDDA